MKKYYILLLIVILTGCGKLSNTPSKRVEEVLDNYKMLDQVVINQLNNIVSKEETFNESQKELYKDIMKKQYNNLMYEIKDEMINADKAVVLVEITVKDFSKVLKEASNYFELHKKEFEDENGDTTSKYIDYRLDKLKDAKNKINYTLKLSLTKKDKEWVLDGLSDSDIDKISGIYNY